MSTLVDLEQRWVAPEYLEAALEDIVEMLGIAAVDEPRATGGELYTWMFRNRRGRFVTLEITVRRAS